MNGDNHVCDRRTAIRRIGVAAIGAPLLGATSIGRSRAALGTTIEDSFPDLERRRSTTDVASQSYQGAYRSATHQGIHSLVVDKYEPLVDDEGETSGHLITISNVMRSEGRETDFQGNVTEGAVSGIDKHAVGVSVYDSENYQAHETAGWWERENHGAWRDNLGGDTDTFDEKDAVGVALGVGVAGISSAVSFGAGFAISSGFTLMSSLWGEDFTRDPKWDPFQDNFFPDHAKAEDYTDGGNRPAEAVAVNYYFVTKPADHRVQLDINCETRQNPFHIPYYRRDDPHPDQDGYWVTTSPRVRVHLMPV